MPTIRRRGKAPHFEYVDERGKVVVAASVLKYAASLVIPPKYTDVEIYYGTRAGEVCAPIKQTFRGTDEAGRTQYGYSAAWKAKAGKEKFRALIEFGGVLPKMRLEVARLLREARNAEILRPENVIALVVRIMNICHFRLGHARYKSLYKHYGITTIEARHLRFPRAGAAVISFVGKKGVRNSCTFEEADVVALLQKMTAGKGPRDFVFTVEPSEGGGAEPIKPGDVNKWMRQFGVDATSKMFRTYATNVLLVEWLREVEAKAEVSVERASVAQRKKNIIAGLDEVSGEVHNTRSVCKKQYAYPALIDLYLNHPRKFSARFLGSIAPEPAFLAFLRETSGSA